MGGGWRRLDRRGIDGIRGKGGNWGKEGGIGRKERGIVGFMLYGGLIWGMWGAQGVYMAG